MLPYLTMMYLTLDQEKALKDFFENRGWSYSKIDLSSITDEVGPKNWNSCSTNKAIVHEQTNYSSADVFDGDNYAKANPVTSYSSEMCDSPSVNIQDKQCLGKGHTIIDEQTLDVKSKEYLCPKCGKGFTKSVSLNAHLKVHDLEITGNKRQFVCTAKNCGRSFNRKTHLVFHMNIHGEKKPFICEYCGKRYSSQYSHKRHILICHTGDGGRCSLCGKIILEREALLEHKSICHSKSTHRCKHCGATFKWKARLRRHLKKHDDGYMWDNRYDQNYLDYTTSGSKSEQMMDHFQCKNCLKLFKQQEDFDSHAKLKDCLTNLHVGDKNNFVCKHCNKAFKWKQSLYRHRKKHHGSISTNDPIENGNEPVCPQPEEGQQEIVVYFIPESDKSVSNTVHLNDYDTTTLTV